MQMKLQIRYIILVILFACNTTKNSDNKKSILQASREAPLGWLYFELYSDSSFTATNSGLRISSKYHGTYQHKFDTLFLTYSDSVPEAFGKEMLIEKEHLRFLDIPGELTINKTTIDYKSLIENKPIDSLKIKELAMIQGIWEHSKDDRAIVIIQNNFWTNQYDNENFDETERYRIRWKNKLPEFVDTTVNASFLELANKIDTINYEILGLTNDILSLRHYPTGRMHVYNKRK